MVGCRDMTHSRFVPSLGAATRISGMLLLGAVAVLAIAVAAEAQTYWGAPQPNVNSGYTVNSAGDMAKTAVALTNTGAGPATGTISNSFGVIATVTVPAGQTSTFTIPNEFKGSRRADGFAFKVETDRSMVVSQFTPLVVGVSNDASLLLEEGVLGTEHYANAYVEGPDDYGDPADPDFQAYVMVVATQDDTVVSIRPTSTTVAGVGVGAIGAGSTYTVTLDAYELLNVQSYGILTGSKVLSDKPVAVFSGSVCTWLGASACDHTHEQIPSTLRSGLTYILCTSAYQRPGGYDYIEVVAAAAPAFVTVTPPPLSGPGSFTLSAPGATMVLEIEENTVIEATNRISVAQMYGKGLGVGYDPGDPSLVVNTPVEFMVADHQYYTPETWANTRLNIGGPVGATVTYNGLAAENWVNIGTTGYACTVEQIVPGTGVLTSDVPVDVTVLGIGGQGTYWYETGANYVPPPPPPIVVDAEELEAPNLYRGIVSLPIAIDGLVGGGMAPYTCGWVDISALPLTSSFGADSSCDTFVTFTRGGYKSIRLNGDDFHPLVDPGFSTAAVHVLEAEPGGPYTATIGTPLDLVGTTFESVGPYTCLWSPGTGGVFTDSDADPCTISAEYDAAGTYTHLLRVWFSDDPTLFHERYVDVVVENESPDKPSASSPRGATQTDGTNEEVAAMQSDGDGIQDSLDNCPSDDNFGQQDLDHDGQGDACDADADGDGLEDANETCDEVASTDNDFDRDGLADACDPDDDADVVLDGTAANPIDNCRMRPNPDQADLDADGLGDACDEDWDADGVANLLDAYPTDPARWDFVEWTAAGPTLVRAAPLTQGPAPEPEPRLSNAWLAVIVAAAVLVVLCIVLAATGRRNR